MVATQGPALHSGPCFCAAAQLGRTSGEGFCLLLPFHSELQLRCWLGPLLGDAGLVLPRAEAAGCHGSAERPEGTWLQSLPASNGLALNWRRGFAAGCRGRRELAPAWVRFPACRLPPVINPNQALLCIQAGRLGLEGRNKEWSRGLGRGRRPRRSCRLPTLGTSRPLPRGEGARTCRGARSARSSRHRRRGRRQERRVQIRLHLSHPADASPSVPLDCIITARSRAAAAFFRCWASAVVCALLLMRFLFLLCCQMCHTVRGRRSEIVLFSACS